MNELKSELKKRNMTVSGAKVQLIERLRPHLEATIASGSNQMKNITPSSSTSSVGIGSKIQITPSGSTTFIQPSTPASPSTFVIVSSSKENSPAPLNQPGKLLLMVIPAARWRHLEISPSYFEKQKNYKILDFILCKL